MVSGPGNNTPGDEVGTAGGYVRDTLPPPASMLFSPAPPLRRPASSAWLLPPAPPPPGVRGMRSLLSSC